MRCAISTAFAAIAVLAASLCTAADNVALHKPYAMLPAPNYPLTTDPGDAWQLTDGNRVSGPRMWTSPEAVGWLKARPVVVTIDLGANTSIVGAAFSTAAGVAGVEWPRAIYLLGSEDARRFSYLGDLIALDAKRGGRPP